MFVAIILDLAVFVYAISRLTDFSSEIYKRKSKKWMNKGVTETNNTGWLAKGL